MCLSGVRSSEEYQGSECFGNCSNKPCISFWLPGMNLMDRPDVGCGELEVGGWYGDYVCVSGSGDQRSVMDQRIVRDQRSVRDKSVLATVTTNHAVHSRYL